MSQNRNIKGQRNTRRLILFEFQCFKTQNTIDNNNNNSKNKNTQFVLHNTNYQDNLDGV